MKLASRAFGVFALLLSFSAKSEESILGTWAFSDRAHEGIYGNLRITAKEVRFSRDGKHWRCATKYSLVDPGVPPLFVDSYASGPEWSNPGEWEYVKLSLSTSHCTSAKYFLFALPKSQYGPSTFAELSDEQKLLGLGYFHRWKE